MIGPPLPPQVEWNRITASKREGLGVSTGLYIQLHSIHGLIRGANPELGADADTGGQVLYVLALAQALGRHPAVERVDLLTRLIRDPAVAPDYAVARERLSDRSAIVRIPCGPDAYLRKEELWPYLDEYVANVAAYIEGLGRVPDLLHSHYADAGGACTRLSHLLGLPQVHTGHSLGRAKQRQLLATGASSAEVEATFHLARRIAEEEATLSHAAIIVASTHQERREQYGLYDADAAAKIHVIPPGIDVSRFFAYFEGRSPAVIKKMNAEFRRFLKNNDKPPILTISRPDRKKNLAALVHAYGQDPDLRDHANLVIFAGVRTDIATMPTNEREVLTELLVLMDKYDLYGKMALPKTHEFETDVPALYRMTARKGGIFVNTSINEAFGLTLLEAAASGLPIVATNDGGPPDIVGACRNGIVVPPTDTKAIARAMKFILDDPERWHAMSEAGIRGVRAHYTWDAHIEAYLALVDQIRGGGAPEVSLRDTPAAHKLVVCDVDDVLTADLEATRRLAGWLSAHRDEVRFAVTTGRTLTSVRHLLAEGRLPAPDFILACAGTEIYSMPDFRPITEWGAHSRWNWDRGRVRKVLDDFAHLLPQEANAQSRYKLSYYLLAEDARPLLEAIEARLAQTGVRCRVVFSNENLLDVIPDGASKADALEWLRSTLELAPDDLLVCGDSGDDADMMQIASRGVLPAHHLPEIAHLAKSERVYVAASAHADAVLEAIAHYGFVAQAPPATGSP